MELAALILIALASATAASVLAFMVGRCGRRLPIDGVLPHVVQSARFCPERDWAPPAQEPAGPSWPQAD